MGLKHTVKDISKHSLIYMAGWGVSALIRLGLLPVFTRYIDRTDYGTLSILDTSVELLRILCALGFTSSIVRFYNDNTDPEYRRSVISTGAVLILLLTLGFGMIIFPLSNNFSKLILGNDNQVILFQLTFATILFNTLRGMADSYFTVNKNSSGYVGINITQAIFQAILNLYFIVYVKLGITGLLIGNLITAIIFDLGLYLYVISKNGFTVNKRIIYPMLKFALPLVPTVMAGAAIHSMDRFFIKHFSTLEQVGLYSLAYQFPFMLNTIFMTSFVRVWDSSSIYEIARSSDASYQYGRICTYFMTILGFALYALSIMSDTVINIFAAPSYFSTHFYIPVIALGVWGYSLHTFVRVGVNIAKKTYLFTYNYLQALTCNVILNLLLIPRYGAFGAAWATVVTYFCFSVGGYFIYRKCYPVVLEWSRLGKVLALAVFLFTIRDLFVTSNALIRISIELALVLAFPATLFFINGFLSSDEKKYIVERGARLYKRCIREA